MGGNLLISPADFKRAEDIANIKMGTFISVPLVSSHFLLHHFLIILSTGQFIFAHFPKLPTDLLIMSQSPWLWLSRFSKIWLPEFYQTSTLSLNRVLQFSQTELFEVFSITSQFPTPDLCLCPLLFLCGNTLETPSLCQFLNEAFLAHASRMVIFYLINSCKIFYAVPFNFLAGICFVWHMFQLNLHTYTCTETKASWSYLQYHPNIVPFLFHLTEVLTIIH